MKVEVRNGNVDKALRTLKKKLFDDGTIQEYMRRRFYEKPSVTKRRKKLETINRQKKIREEEQKLLKRK